MSLSNPKDRVLEVSCCDGKYTVCQDKDGKCYALRYGQEWRDCIGDNLVLSLAQEIEDLRDIIIDIRGWVTRPLYTIK